MSFAELTANQQYWPLNRFVLLAAFFGSCVGLLKFFWVFAVRPCFSWVWRFLRGEQLRGFRLVSSISSFGAVEGFHCFLACQRANPSSRRKEKASKTEKFFWLIWLSLQPQWSSLPHPKTQDIIRVIKGLRTSNKPTEKEDLASLSYCQNAFQNSAFRNVKLLG